MPVARAAAQENVLVIVADDLGVDRVGCYAEHPNPGRTPNIDRLAARGVLFRNAWSSPLCSPTRAGLLTGRHAFRTGIGDIVDYGSGPGQALKLAETTLPELLDAGTGGRWDHAAIGKWHLGTASAGPLHPLLSGFARHRGALGNLGTAAAPGNYFAYLKAVDGRFAPSRVYATTDAVDDALAAIDEMSEPWLLYLCFNAPHQPYHVPPDALQSFDLGPSSTPVQYMKAMTEAMDTEIGRLLASVPANVLRRTNVVFLGDNGTDPDATTAPFSKSHAKGTVYEGGVNVPLIVAGPRVRHPGSECAALVQTLDLFATVADIAGVAPASVLPPATPLDSISLLPYLGEPALPSLRRHAFTETFAPNGNGPYTHLERAIRDDRYKLVRKLSYIVGPGGEMEVTSDELYDLLADPFEHDDLLLPAPPPAEAATAYEELKAALSALLATEP